MKFGFRIPSFRKRIAARTSIKRVVRHSLGFKVPRGWGWLTNPRKAAYNRIYNRTSKGCLFMIVALAGGVLFIVGAIRSFPDPCGSGRSHQSQRINGAHQSLETAVWPAARKLTRVL